MQMLPQDRNVVQSSGLQSLDHIAARQDDYRVPVLPDLPVSLTVEVRGSDQDAELAVPEPRDEPTCLPHADAVGRCIALGLQSKLDRNGVRMRAKQVLPDSISATVAPWPGDVDLVHVGLAHSPQVRGELLKVMRVVLEVLIYQVKKRPVSRNWLLLLAGPDDYRRRCKQRRIRAAFYPRSPDRGAGIAQRLPRHELVDPGARDRRGIQDSEPGLVVLKSHPARRAPNSNQILFATEPVGARCQKAPEPDVTASAWLVEQQKWRDLDACRRITVHPVEHPGQQQVPLLRRVLQCPARPPVVAVVGESTGVGVQGIGPVRFLTSGVQRVIENSIRRNRDRWLRGKNQETC